MFPTQRRTLLAAVLAAFACSAIAQQQPAAKGGKHHTLPATLETVQWGWLDPKEPPKLTINSGDTVSIETMMHAHNKVQQGITMEQIVELRKANPGGGPHSMTGPIYVNGAEPGDVMEIRILKIVPKSFGITFNLPGKDFPTIGALAPEMPDGLIWTGDSHCRQGNGEVSLTGLECSYKEIVLQPIVRKDMKLEWPRLETRTHWITTGFDEDLNKAMVNATREAVNFLAEQKTVPMSRAEAYLLASVVGDCRVSQVVDIRKGVHCMIPKNIFTKKECACCRRKRRA